MKHLFRKTALLLSIIIWGNLLYSQGFYDSGIPKKDAQALAVKLYSDMQGLHPNLYEYISKEDYDKAYNQLIHNLDTADYYNPSRLLTAFQEFVALCRDAHSGVGSFQKSMPAKKSKNQATPSTASNSDIRTFPFFINIVKEKIYVSNHCFGDDAIPLKSEIVSIGNQSAEGWLQKQRARTSGERDALRDAQLSGWQIFKPVNSDSCKFGYIPDGSKDTLYKTLNCKVNRNQYYDFIIKNFAPSGFLTNIKAEDVFKFRAIDEGRIGIITMYRFLPEKKMTSLINKALDSVKFYGVEDLIIDLRQSPGGHAESGYALIDRITEKPYRTESEEHAYIKYAMQDCSNVHMRKIWQHRKYIKKEDVKRVWAAGKDTVIVHQYQEITPKNYKNKFTGRIWVLTSSYTGSAAVGFAAIVQDCNLGVVVGEETGGIPNTLGNPMFYPLTGALNDKWIQYYYVAPHMKTIRPSGDDSMKLRGVIPDIEIEPNIIPDEDLQLQTLIDIIQERREERTP